MKCDDWCPFGDETIGYDNDLNAMDPYVGQVYHDNECAVFKPYYTYVKQAYQARAYGKYASFKTPKRALIIKSR